MKRIIYSNENFSDKIGNISLIVYCEDINMEYPTAIVASEDSYSDEQEYLDRIYLGYSDKSLLGLSEEEIHRIQNLYLIQRIGSLNSDMYNKLSHTQKMAFAKYAKGFHWLGEEDIPLLIKHLKTCNSIEILHFHKRTNNFKVKYGLTDNDLLELFHSIESSDVDVENSQLSYDKFDYGNQIIIFKKLGVSLSCGVDLSNLEIYMKLDYDETDDSTIVFISIHEDIY